MRSNLLRWKITNTFLKNWNTQKRIVINRGGTRSGKTYALLMMMANWLLTGRLRDNYSLESGICSVVRKNKTTIKGTAMRDFEEILREYGLYDLLSVNKQDRTYKFGDRMVEFIGADDQQKLRGGKRDILYCNEANELQYDQEFFQLLIRTTGLVFLDFNPSDPYTWIKKELEDKRGPQRGDVETVITTYVDNGTLSDVQISEIEYLKETDDTLWRVYGLGQYGKVKGLIYPNWKIIDEIPEDAKRVGAGLDFGFSNSATAWIDCAFIEPNNLYVDQRIYAYGLTDRLLIRELKNIDYPKRRVTIADSAQAGSIAEIQSAGYNLHPANKFKNSVVFGVNLLRQVNWHVTAHSEDVLRELRTYKYKKTRSGDWLNEPEEGNDHAMDAIRYYALSNLVSLSPRRGRRTASTKK